MLNNFEKPYNTVRFGLLQEGHFLAAGIGRVIGFLQISTKRVLAKIKIPYYTTNPRTQKVTLPEEAQIQIAFKIFKKLSHFCHQSADGAINSSVASRPYSPHVKDCAGLEKPNTLKLIP